MRIWRYLAVTMTIVLTQAPSALATPDACYAFYQAKAPDEKYALWLEQDTPERAAWIRKESGETLRTLQNSKNYPTISDAVLSQNSKPMRISADANKDAAYELHFMGLNKPQHLYRVTPDGRSTVLTTSSITSDTSFSLLQVYSSPKDTHVVLTASDNGNIDVFQTYVYDLKTQSVVRQFSTDGQQITWKNDTEFFFSHAGTGLSTYNIKTGVVRVVKKPSLVFIDKDSYIKYDNGNAHLMIRNQEKIFLPKSFFNLDMSVETLTTRENGDLLLFANNAWANQGQILKRTRKNGKNRWDVLFQTPKNSVIESVQFNEDHIAVNSFWGPSIVTKILDFTGKELAEIPAPSCCLMNQVQYKQGTDILDVIVSSHFKQGVTFKYSLKEKRYLDPTLEHQMMSYDGMNYTSAIHWATSKDGTRLPVRLTYRKDLVRNGQNPLLIYGYGGFMSAGYMNSFNAKMDALFIKNGGIIAGPALRGGNEFGKKWHESATFEKKHKTMEDFVATALLVHGLELSSPKITAIQGWSNGGFITSATGLLYPHVIGIVVSGNGVNDQLRKEILDALFGAGWAYEYGDSRHPHVKKYMKQWGPVYLAQRAAGTPEMLFMNGRLDSRVNSAHSFKIALALKTHSTTPEKVNLISIANSGHFMTSVLHQNTIAWKSQTLIWTFLFDKMGMTARF